MKKLSINQSGITHIVVVLALLVFTVLGLAGWRVYDHQQRAKSDDSKAAAKLVEKLQSTANTTNVVATGDVTKPGDTQPTTAPKTTQSTSTSSTKPSASSTPSSSPKQSGISTSPSYPGDNGDTPLITLTNPSSWKQTVSGVFTASATASDSSGVKKVIFRIQKIGQADAVQTVIDYSAPYTAALDVSALPNGDSDYTVSAQVFDNAGHGNSASYRINIQN